MGKQRNSSEQALRERLTPEQYQVTQAAGTERPFTGDLLEQKGDGTFVCVCCGKQDTISQKESTTNPFLFLA